MGWRGCSRVTTLSWWSRRCSIMLYNEIAISRKSGACWTAKAMELPLRKVISNNNSYLFPLFYPFQSPSSVKIQIHLRVSSSQMKDTCRSLECLALFSHTIIIQLKITYEIFFYQGCFSILYLNNFFNWNFIVFCLYVHFIKFASNFISFEHKISKFSHFADTWYDAPWINFLQIDWEYIEPISTLAIKQPVRGSSSAFARKLQPRNKRINIVHC